MNGITTNGITNNRIGTSNKEIYSYALSKTINASAITGVNTNSMQSNDTKKKIKKRKEHKYDILNIHNEIIENFNKEYENISLKKKELEKIKWIKENSLNTKERIDAERQYNKLQKDIYLANSGIPLAQYLYHSEDILKKYEELIERPIEINFMKIKKTNIHKEKEKLIEEYINIAKNYIELEPVISKVTPSLCEFCNTDMKTVDDLLLVCPKCGYSHKNLASTSGYQDNSRINNAQRYTYEKEIHFYDAIKKYQGKQNTTIPDKVYQDLRRKIESHDIPYSKLNKDHIYEFLKSTKNNDYYEDINLIYCQLTGTPPPDISHLEEKLKSLFKEIDNIYEEVKPPGRLNFLNGQYVLFRFLQKLKYPCKTEDFSILKTRDKLLEYEEIWKKICARKKWNYRALL